MKQVRHENCLADAVAHAEQAVGVDALADERFAQQFVIRLHVLEFPKLLGNLLAAALLLSLLEGKGVHNHVGDLVADEVAQRGHSRPRFLCLGAGEDGQAAVLRDHNLLHLHASQRGVVGRGVGLLLLGGDASRREHGKKG